MSFGEETVGGQRIHAAQASAHLPQGVADAAQEVMMVRLAGAFVAGRRSRAPPPFAATRTPPGRGWRGIPWLYQGGAGVRVPRRTSSVGTQRPVIRLDHRLDRITLSGLPFHAAPCPAPRRCACRPAKRQCYAQIAGKYRPATHRGTRRCRPTRSEIVQPWPAASARAAAMPAAVASRQPPTFKPMLASKRRTSGPPARAGLTRS